MTPEPDKRQAGRIGLCTCSSHPRKKQQALALDYWREMLPGQRFCAACEALHRPGLAVLCLVLAVFAHHRTAS